jgi:cytochrome b6-f complex iron-sulfur subunit
MTTISRRKFLETSAVGGAALSVGVGAAGCGNDVEPAPRADVTVGDNIKDLATYGVITVPVAMYPQLQKVGGALTLHIAEPTTSTAEERAYAIPRDNTVLLVHYAENEFASFQSACPHLGCPLGYSVKDAKVECPCHGSRFRVLADPADSKSCAGAVVHRPAPVGLESWETKYVGGNVTVNLTVVRSCNKAFPPIVNNTITLPLSDFPQLAMTGGFVTGQPPGARNAIIVVRKDDTTVAALSATCTHLGCTVAYTAESGELDCPCHGSAFSLEGRVLNGPATLPLSSYTADLTADSVIVTLR